jgi:hypothetical protein
MNDFDKILDECIDRIGHGESLEACLTRYPEYAKQLEPLLRVMTQTKEAYSFTPSVDAKREARKRFFGALEKERQPSVWQRVFARRALLATLTTVLAIVIAFFALRATVFTGEPPVVTVPNPNANGNFSFLVSDEVNALSDFLNLYVTVGKVGLLQTGTSEKWVEFVPEVKEFDLTLLPGAKTQELWRGDVPEGTYTKVVLYVSGVNGTLKENGQTIEIKLPSNKLEVDSSFQVSAGIDTSFTYDLTVVKTGNAQGGGKYLLKPQAVQSGTSQTSHQSNSKSDGKNKVPSPKTP